MEYSTPTAPSHRPLRAKTVRSGGRSRPDADGGFVRDLQEIGFFTPETPVGALVGKAKSQSPVNLPWDNPEEPLEIRPWERTGETVKALFYHAALKAKADAEGLVFRGFTLRLTEKLEQRARARGKHCLDYLHRQCADHLKRALQPVNAVWAWWQISAEEDENGRLHLHGNAVFRREDWKLVHKALCGAGGRWMIPHPKSGKLIPCPYQLHWSRREPDYRGTGYGLKNTWKADPMWRRAMKRRSARPDPRNYMLRNYIPGFDGRAVTCTKEVKEAARVIHKQAVTEVKAYRRGRKSMPTCTILH